MDGWDSEEENPANGVGTGTGDGSTTTADTKAD